ncbi:MAG: glycosyltransferase family 4 protein [Microcoleaceae cyanobacterium]
MLFDLSVGGHHANYIQHLIHYWHNHHLTHELSVVVSPRFMEGHGEVVDWAHQLNTEALEFIPISAQEEETLNSRRSRLKRLQRNFQEWEILCQYVQKLAVTHCLIMYFDTFELPLAWGVNSPCPFSGIYFRPTFHYPQELAHYHSTGFERLQQLRETIFLRRILSHAQLQNLFSLDPLAVTHLKRFGTKTQILPLADPVETFGPCDIPSVEMQKKLGIDPHRQVFLLFGALTERKGVHQLLDAIALLSDQHCQQICLLFVGQLALRIEAQLKSQIESICQAKPVQIITQYGYVPEEDIQAYLSLADVVLAPYQEHVGMSGILLLAAAAEKPLLSSDYGLMGEMVRRYELGLTLDSTQPLEIAEGLTRFLKEPLEQFFDREKMRCFAEQNSAEKFAETIFQQL